MPEGIITVIISIVMISIVATILGGKYHPRKSNINYIKKIGDIIDYKEDASIDLAKLTDYSHIKVKEKNYIMGDHYFSFSVGQNIVQSSSYSVVGRRVKSDTVIFDGQAFLFPCNYANNVCIYENSFSVTGILDNVVKNNAIKLCNENKLYGYNCDINNIQFLDELKRLSSVTNHGFIINFNNGYCTIIISSLNLFTINLNQNKDQQFFQNFADTLSALVLKILH